MLKKKNNGNFVIIVMLALWQLSFAQDTTTITASNDEISEHLDLEAVASIFGDAKDLQDFEERINDPKKPVSNLDLNEDNNVDFLRVVEQVEDQTHLISIQAVMGKDIYQDVATLEVEKDNNGNAQVQVVGDVFLYGPDYIIEPVYFYRPLIFSIFWRPYYRPFRSVYYWGHYPKHFHFWHPYHVHKYKRHIHGRINSKHRYAHVSHRRSLRAVHIHGKIRRNDFARRYPERSYKARNVGVNKENGTRIRVAAVNKPNGTKIRTAGVNTPDGTKKRVVSVKKPNGDKYRSASVKKGKRSKKRGLKRSGTSKKAIQKKTSTRKKKK